MNVKYTIWLSLILMCAIVSFAAPFDYTETTCTDFDGGDTILVEIISDPIPVLPDDCAITLAEDDTIRVLQIYPDEHCMHCIANAVYADMASGHPPVNFKFELLVHSSFNDITSPADSENVYNPDGSWAGVRCMLDYHIIFFGVADKYGEELENDISTNAKNALIDYAQTGKGVVLTHDTIRKIRVTLWLREHENFNELTDYTGLRAEEIFWDPFSLMYDHVTRDPGADPAAPILNFPFVLPEEFDVTDCHNSGERNVYGEVWYRGRDNAIYMQTYNNPVYNSYFSFFSTGHQETEDGSSFTPTEWETKAMMNAMYYSFYGGRANGIYTSEIIPLDCPAHLDSISMSATLPGISSVIIELCASNDGIFWTDWFEVTPGWLIPPEVASGSFFQYRLLLSRGLPTDEAPVVHSIGLFGSQDIPDAVLLYPPIDAATACSCGVIKFLVNSGSDLNTDFCEIEYDGVTYSGAVFSMSGDTLIFTPPDCFTDGDLHSGGIIRLENEIGCVDDSLDIEFAFTVDLSAPEVIPVEPAPGIAVGAGHIIRAHIEDVHSDVMVDSLYFAIGGDTLYDSDPFVVFWHDTFRIDSAVVIPLGLADSVEVCVYASDTISSELCGPNDTLVCWTFYVDTTAPDISCFDTIITACESLSASFLVTDNVAVQAESTIVTVNGVSYYYPDGISYAGDTLVFKPGIALTDGDVYEISVHCADIFGNSCDACNSIIIVDKLPPEVVIEPTPGESLITAQPTIILCLSDNYTGIDTTSIWLVVNGDTFVVYDGLMVDTCFIWDAATEGLVYYHGETLYFELHAGDLVPIDNCGPNELDSSWFGVITLPAPMANILSPDDGACISCSLLDITALLFAGAALVDDSIIVVFQDETLGVDDPRLSFGDDTLVFSPATPFLDGETIYFEILHAVDSLGASSEHLGSISFVIDLTPPMILASISNGDTIFDPLAALDFSITDHGCGIDNVSFELDDIPILVFDEDSCLGDSIGFSFDPTDYGLYFPEDEISTVQINASDCAVFCDPNSDSLQISFFVPDDDTLPPVLLESSPDLWLEDSIFTIKLVIMDSSGIYTPFTPADTQDAYLLFDTDGEIAVSSNRAELSIDSAFADTIYLSSEIITGQIAHVPFVWQAFFHDNDFDFDRISDRLPGVSEIDSVIIVARPYFYLVHPPESIYTSCNDEDIKILIESDDPVNLNSLEFIVRDIPLSLTDSRCYMQRDTFVIAAPTGGYSEGEIIVLLNSGQTELGYEIPAQSWIFTIDLTPPEIEFIYPIDWEMVSDPNFFMIMQLEDELAGIDTESVSGYFVIDEETLYVSSITADSNATGFKIAIRTVSAIDAGDTVQFTLWFCDMAELCPQNCDSAIVNFWVEPDFACSLSTNPFTPNGDGINDLVRFFYTKPFSTDVTLCIYDLGGREILTRDIPAGDLDRQLWDGKRKNKNVPSGTYVYIINEDSGVICKGTITLVR